MMTEAGVHITADTLPDLARRTLADREDEFLGAAEDAVRRARRLGASSAEAFLLAGRGVDVSLEANEITSLSAGEEWGAAVRVIRGTGVGFAYFTDPAKRDAAIRAALRASRTVPRGGFTFSSGGRYPRVEGGADPRILALDPGEAPAMAKELVSSVRAVSKRCSVAGGGVAWGEGLFALATTEGASVAEHGTSAGVSAYVVTKGKEASTGFEGWESTALDFDVAATGRAAAELALSAEGGRPFGAARKPTVLLRPEAAVQLFEYVALPALAGDKVGRGESFWAGRRGQRVASEILTLVDDPRQAGGLGSGAADDEGEPSRAVNLLENGVLKGYFYDRASAAEYKGRPTASGLRYGGLSDSTTYKEPPRCGARNVVIGGQEKPDLDALVAGIDDGILVHDLLGAHTANATSGDFSMSASLVFRIRKGAVEGPLRSVMLGGNFFDVVGSVEALGGERRKMSGHFSPVCFDAPWMAFGGITVVGQ